MSRILWLCGSVFEPYLGGGVSSFYLPLGVYPYFFLLVLYKSFQVSITQLYQNSYACLVWLVIISNFSNASLYCFSKSNISNFLFLYINVSQTLQSGAFVKYNIRFVAVQYISRSGRFGYFCLFFRHLFPFGKVFIWYLWVTFCVQFLYL